MQPASPVLFTLADLQAFGPFGKHEGKAVARLAALYGCRASLQGSKSNKKLVVVSRRATLCAAPPLASTELCPQGPVKALLASGS